MKISKYFFTNRQFFSTLLILFITFTCVSFSDSKKSPQYDFSGFKNKSYYTTLFNQAEIIKLSESEEIYDKGKKYMLDSDDQFRKAEGYNKLGETGQTNHSGKVARYEKKGIKLAIKAYENYFIAIEKKFRLYADKLSNTNFDNGKRHLKAEEYSIDARSFFLNGSQLIEEAKKMKGKTQLELYKSAYNEQIKAIEKQEIAFMILMNDPLTNDINNIKEETSDNQFTDEQDQNPIEYNPMQDPNIYTSKEEIITENIQFSEEDLELLKELNEKIQAADLQMKEADEEYKKMEKLRNEAENSDNEYDRNMKIKMASGLEEMIFEKMIEAADIYYNADKTRYEVYLKYLPKAKTSKNEEKAKKHEQNAGVLHINAGKLYNKTKFYSDSKTNRYIQLMNAVQTELSAIREIENAFMVYFEQEPVPIEDLVDVIEEQSEEPGKTSDNKVKQEYNYAGSFVYSMKYPDPKPLVHKQGIVFKVQIGLFKELLPVKPYANFSPITFDTFKNNPYKRFMLGEYRSDKVAEIVLEKMKAKGFTDAFIVAFETGERKTFSYGVSKMVKNSDFEKIEKEEMNKINGIVNTDTNNENNFQNNNFNDISKTKGLIYCIQLGNFSSGKSFNEFNGINPILTDYSENSYKYLTGNYKNYDAAKKQVPEMQQKGFKDAFITAYYNGKRVSLNDAKKYEQNNDITGSLNTEIIFAVQIGLFSHKLSNEELKQYDVIQKKYPISIHDSGNGLYLYSAGKFKSYDEANNAKSDIKNLNFDGFVIAFNKGVKISASEAINLQKK